jgi:hypothetical protein
MAGATGASSSATTATAPHAGIAGTLRSIVAAEGPRGLYRGLGATLAQVAPALAINYSVYGRLRAAWMEGRPPGEPPTVRLIGGEWRREVEVVVFFLFFPSIFSFFHSRPHTKTPH